MTDYFEMGEAERSLHMISNSLNYCAATLSVGIGTDYNGLSTPEVIDLQYNACNRILDALKDVDTLLNAVQEDKP